MSGTHVPACILEMHTRMHKTIKAVVSSGKETSSQGGSICLIIFRVGYWGCGALVTSDTIAVMFRITAQG